MGAVRALAAALALSVPDGEVTASEEASRKRAMGACAVDAVPAGVVTGHLLRRKRVDAVWAWSHCGGGMQCAKSGRRSGGQRPPEALEQQEEARRVLRVDAVPRIPCLARVLPVDVAAREAELAAERRNVARQGAAALRGRHRREIGRAHV